MATWLGELQQFLGNISATDDRLLFSVFVVGLGIVLVGLVIPVVIRRSRSLVRNRVFRGVVGRAIDIANESLPTSLGGILCRVSQLLVVVGVTFVLVVTWGLVEEVRSLLRFFEFSTPIVVRIGLSVGLAVLVFIGSDQYKRFIASIGKKATWMSEHQQEIVVRLGQVTILSVGILVGLSIWNVDVQGLLVGAGFLGIVVGLAARQTLGSFIAGLVLMFSRPFKIGDWVKIGNDEGIITEISILQTRMKNFDGEVVVIPNDTVANNPIVNRSTRGLLRISLDVGIDYESDPDRAKEVGKEVIKEVGQVADAPPPRVIPKAFGDSAIVMEMRFWIEHPTPPRRWQAIEAVVTKIKASFEEEGIRIPFPQRELSGRAEMGGFDTEDTGPPETTDSPDA